MSQKTNGSTKKTRDNSRFRHPDPSTLPPRNPLGYLRGRPAKYTKRTFAEKASEYLELKLWEGGDWIVTLLDFCCFAGLYKDYISEHDLRKTKEAWSKNDFSETIKVLKTQAENCLESGTMSGRVNPTMAIFSLKNNYGWVDKQEVETNNNTTVAASFRIVRPSSKAAQTATENGNGEETE